MAISDLPINYQWQCNGTNLPGATSGSQLLENVQLSQAGDYRLTLQTVAGAVTNQWFAPDSVVTVVVPLALSAARAVNGVLPLTVSGPAGQAFYIDESTDTQTWQRISTNTVASSGSIIVPLALVPSNSACFFKAETLTSLRIDQ